MIVSSSGDYGKPRPAVIIQSDAFCDLPSVVVALITSDQRESSRLFRLPIEPTAGIGLRCLSDVMVDKLLTFPQEKVGTPIGRLTKREMGEVTAALSLLLGI